MKQAGGHGEYALIRQWHCVPRMLLQVEWEAGNCTKERHKACW